MHIFKKTKLRWVQNLKLKWKKEIENKKRDNLECFRFVRNFIWKFWRKLFGFSLTPSPSPSTFSKILIEIMVHWLHPMCNPLMCNIVPNVQHFFEQFVFCLVSPLCNTQEKFQLQNDKNERKWVEHGFQNDKIDL